MRAFPALKKLKLNGNKIGNAGISTLSRTAFANTLESLGLRSTDITAIGTTQLVHPGTFISLQNLSLSDNPQIGYAGIAALSRAQFAPLNYLNAQNTDVTPEEEPELLRLGIAHYIAPRYGLAVTVSQQPQTHNSINS